MRILHLQSCFSGSSNFLDTFMEVHFIHLKRDYYLLMRRKPTPQRDSLLKEKLLTYLGMVVAFVTLLAILWRNASIWECQRKFGSRKIMLFMYSWNFLTVYPHQRKNIKFVFTPVLLPQRLNIFQNVSSPSDALGRQVCL